MHRFLPKIALAATLLLVAAACSISPSEPSGISTTTLGELPADSLVLAADGVVPFIFGAPGQQVIDGVTATIGGWDADSTTSDLVDPPTCPGGSRRDVSWGSLVLTFATSNGVESFSGWSYGFDPLTGNSDDLRRLDLETTEGIGLGSTRTHVADAYGSAVVFTDDEALDTATFIVNAAEAPLLAGKLDAAGPMGVVDFLETTPAC